MFNNKRISELEIKFNDKIVLLTNHINEINTKLLKLPNIDIEFNKLKNEIEKRLIEFHKEITDKYFETLEKILRVNSESSLITALAHQVNQKDLSNLRSVLLKPFLEEKWKNEEIQKGFDVDKKLTTLGQQLIKMRKNLYDEMLIKEREGEDINEIKGKVEILNYIIGDKL